MEEFGRQLQAGQVSSSLMPLDAALARWPACRVGPETARAVLHGVPVLLSMVMEWDGRSDPWRVHEEPIRIKDAEGRLLAIGTLCSANGLNPEERSNDRIAIRKVLMSEETATCVS